jgi:hypothetical protein
VKLDEEHIDEVNSYTYLGEQINNDHNEDEEISLTEPDGQRSEKSQTS